MSKLLVNEDAVEPNHSEKNWIKSVAVMGFFVFLLVASPSMTAGAGTASNKKNSPDRDHCGAVWEYSLMVGQQDTVGRLIFKNDIDRLYVTYSLKNGWVMTNSYLYFGYIPTLPPTIVFDYQTNHGIGVVEYTYTFPLSMVYIDSSAVAVRADVVGSSGSQIAWGYDTSYNGISNRNVNGVIVFQHYVQECLDGERPETIWINGLNWNNGNTSDKDGANGAGIISFSVDGIILKNNKNYVTPVNFDKVITKAPAKNEEPAIYTVTERTVTNNGKYEKVYDVKVALYKDNVWKGYEGTITVDNPGGNDKNQKIELVRVF